LKLLLIFLDETDSWEEMTLYEALLRRMIRFNVAGATAVKGVMGFGSHHMMHHRRLLGISDDHPITIMVVEREEKLRALLSTIRPMAPEAVMLMVDAEIL